MTSGTREAAERKTAPRSGIDLRRYAVETYLEGRGPEAADGIGRTPPRDGDPGRYSNVPFRITSATVK
ncbi:hypothetical protein SAMN04487844_11272 [Methylobacterium sp. yr596]|jgi:hypothetical protein|nr:hypothetical protein SAMN04487844_11272 [Methylobacterium sp. yr596]